MFRKALIPFFLATALIMTLAPLPAPTHAQEAGQSEQYALPVDELISRLKRFDEFGSLVVVPDWGRAQPDAAHVPLAVSVETAEGAAFELALDLVGISSEGRLRWQVADWQLADEGGTVVDDPPRIIAVLIGQLKQEWGLAFAEALLERGQARHPDGPPGQPQCDGVSVQNGEVIVDLTWNVEVDEPRWWSLDVPEESARTDDAGNLVYVISQPEINAAKQIIFDTSAMIQNLRYELAEGQVVAVISLQGVAEENQASLRLEYAPNPDFDGSTRTVYPFLGSDASGNAVFHWIEWDLLDGSMDSGDDAAQRGAIMASKALNRYLAAAVNFAEVLDMRAVDGGIEVTVAPAEEESNRSSE